MILYRTGMFSKMNRVTIKALRYYDEIGLLKPAYIDEMTGYRYYTSEQLPIIHKIMALRQMGCTIDEIIKIQKDEDLHKILLQKKQFY
ncbi:MerR family transcriptional regulator [endosymbiont 'TC1' of Trimyema compressum]|uniref:MerR family transcriptional regulator n=1 Tax=endosymbiont 'TC1' of Trimyema compressum TaxID=243899 RepID=UPI001FE0D410|nr:MerR family transcriptional regulator [endosymbiont 'TC1' of Trimyema compressum]